MPAPRLSVAVCGASHSELGKLLAQTRHKVSYTDDIENASMVVLEGPDIPGLVARFEPQVRRGQIVVHTSMDHDVEVLDPLEIRGAIVAAARPVTSSIWAVDYVDELAEGTIALLISEVGASAIHVRGRQREDLAATQNYLRDLDVARREVNRLLDTHEDNARQQIEAQLSARRFAERPIDPLISHLIARFV